MPDYAVGFAGLLVFTNLSQCLMECNYLLCKTVLIPGIIGSIMTLKVFERLWKSMLRTTFYCLTLSPSFLYAVLASFFGSSCGSCSLQALHAGTCCSSFFPWELQKPACFAIFSWKLGKWNVRLRHDFLICTIGNHGIFCHFVIVVGMHSFDS